jgi:hypothetical protein
MRSTVRQRGGSLTSSPPPVALSPRRLRVPIPRRCGVPRSFLYYNCRRRALGHIRRSSRMAHRQRLEDYPTRVMPAYCPEHNHVECLLLYLKECLFDGINHVPSGANQGVCLPRIRCPSRTLSVRIAVLPGDHAASKDLDRSVPRQ